MLQYEHCTSKMLNLIKEILVEFAKISSFVKGLILLGSVAVNQHTDLSDLDILFVLEKEKCETQFQIEIVQLLNNLHLDSLWRDQADKFGIVVKAKVFMVGKTIIFISDKKGMKLKIDAAHTKDIKEKAKFIIGSEIKLAHLKNAILLDYFNDETDKDKERKGEVGEIYSHISNLLSQVNPYTASGVYDADPKFHIRHFVESFDICLSCVEKNDKYRVQFYLFLLRHHLISVQLLLAGLWEHIYLPKHAYKREEVARFSVETEKPLQELERMLQTYGALDMSTVEIDEMFNMEIFYSYIALMQERLHELQAKFNVQ